MIVILIQIYHTKNIIKLKGYNKDITMSNSTMSNSNSQNNKQQNGSDNGNGSDKAEE